MSDAEPQIYRCRVLKPEESEWFRILAHTPEEAANGVHGRESGHRIKSIPYSVDDEQNGHYKVLFALIEVEGYGSFVSRIYSYGIWRKGGVKPWPPQKLETIAKALEWEHPPEALLEPGWAGEETMEEALQGPKSGQ